MNKEQNCVNEGYIDSFRLYQMKCCLSVVTPESGISELEKVVFLVEIDFFSI